MQSITIITGKKEQGKTSLISNLIDEFRNSGYKICGLYSPAVLKNGKKVGIEAVNLINGDKRLLAQYDPGWDPEKPIREWRFDQKTIEWGNEVLKNFFSPCDILIIDEIGYLELEKKEGWNEIFNILRIEQFRSAYIVIRESLLHNASGFWPGANIIHIDKIKDKGLFVQEEVQKISTHQ